MRAAPSLLALATALTLLACKGNVTQSLQRTGGPAQNNPSGNNAVVVNTDVTGIGTVGARRLSRREYDDALELLLEDTTRPAVALPEDNIDPFDNDWEAQRVSQALIEALETVATRAATDAMADPARRDRILGCSPSGADDEACFASFVESFGRRALRRPLTQAERDGLMGLRAFAVESGDFYFGASLVIQALLQMPDFVYHLQRGVPVDGQPGVYRLTQFEVASRLSFFLWGTPPDDALLDAAAGDQLATPAQVRAQAERLLGDPRARTRFHRFHALWLGYHRFEPTDGLTQAMANESERLIDRVVFDEKRDYFDLFTTNETFLNDTLAAHYGLEAPGSAEGTWITYPQGVERGGILSHATFLGVAAKFGDTSPTQRGRVIRERLMCQPILPPPANLEVDVDAPPPEANGSSCKHDRYQAISDQAGCVGCHSQMDPIGLGLENFDQFGQFRATDVGKPECQIAGDGELVGVGAFRGPRELGVKLVESGRLESCLVDRLYQFATAAKPGDADRETIRALRDSFVASGHRLDQLILDLATSEAFVYRVSPEVTP